MHLVETDHDRRLDAFEAGKFARKQAEIARHVHAVYGCANVKASYVHDAIFMAMKDRPGFLEGYKAEGTN